MEERKRQRRWMRLDNAAKLYPAVRTKNWCNVFRLSITLNENIDPDVLQKALNVTVGRFPSIAVRLCKGFFWYYLEEIESAPAVIPDRPYPCGKMTADDMKRCAFRVLYYKKRIAVEFFHSLTDGNGGLIFLKTLAAEYITQKESVNIPAEFGVLNRNEEPNDREFEDSFLKYHGHKAFSKREKTAYRITGTKENDDFHGVTIGIVDLKSVLSKAKKHGVSLTAYLAAVMALSIIQIQDSEVPDKRKQKPVKILIPVNLRNYFKSSSMRNFVLYVIPEIEANMGDFTFEEILQIVYCQMKLQLTEKQMQARITANVKVEKNKFLKALPLFVKNIGMKTAFSMVGEKKSSITMSNLGAVRIPDEMRKFTERFDFTLGVQATGCNNCGILSYGDKLYKYDKKYQGIRT